MKATPNELLQAMQKHKISSSLTRASITKELRVLGYKFSDKTLRAALASINTKLPAVTINKGVASGIPEDKTPKIVGTIKAPSAKRKVATGKRFVLTAAQNNTKLNAGFWSALQQFCKHTGAELMVAKFSYNKGAWKGVTRRGEHKGIDDEGVWYTPEIEPYAVTENIQIADGLLFCAQLDILPTVVNPLGGLDNYTGINSGVIPHAKMHMRSLATLRSGHPWKALYTTGTCTQRNYIERKAGQVASFHHVYGALYVEVADDGTWFTRQLNAEDDGSFYDLGTLYTKKGVANDNENKIIVLGDIHAEKTDPVAFQGAMNMLASTDASYVVVHDLLDFENRNHHNKKDPFFLAEEYYKGGSVEKNFMLAVRVLNAIQQAAPRARILLVRSNHDMAFLRWLREGIEGADPVNAAFYHRCAYRVYEAISNKEHDFDIYATVLEDVAKAQGISTDRWQHIREDDSYVIHGIEFGMHGHLGPNGARGNPSGYRQLGVRACTGHTHSAGILDGIWTAGVLAKLNMGYNKGPSSWSQSSIWVHPNGKRQMITQRGERWRA